MVAAMDPNLDPSNLFNFVSVAGEYVDDCYPQSDAELQNEAVLVRTVAMSANIACTVKDEVKHLIRVNTFESTMQKEDYNQEGECGVPSASGHLEQCGKISRSTYSSCSHILPAEKENIILSIVLSKWDDIMGPQTVHVWLPELKYIDSNSKKGCVSESSHFISGVDSKGVGQTLCSHDDKGLNLNLFKALKYVTSHTVNYTGVSLSSSNVAQEEKDCNLFVVPDLGIVAQSLVFHVHSASVVVPFSLAVVVDLERYSYFLHLRQICHQWLRRMSVRLYGLLLKYLSSTGGLESSTIAKLDHWVMDLCHTVFSLGVCGLGSTTSTYQAEILNHPLLERALTSHLQTFGCTVIMGTSPEDINLMISFLALFLDTDEKFCSRFVLPTMKYSFHVGLFLQGLLLDEFGCRELSSVELAASPYLVTAVDLTRGINPSAVRQTPPSHLQRGDWVEPDETSLHRSMLIPVKEVARLVKVLVSDLKHLAPSNWQDFINVFLKKVGSLAHTLLSLVHYLRDDSLHRNNLNGGTLSRHLMWSLNLHEGDFLIVLAAAEKLKPGVYSYVLGLDAANR